MKQKTNRDLSAFTLVEVVVLILVIGVLALIFLPNMAGRSRSGQIGQRCQRRNRMDANRAV
jgi:type II secretory pathway pseudopilin PulG